jgi:hypothetical protein
VVAIKYISPRSSMEDLTEEMIDASIEQLRRCFGLKNNTSSRKKIKIEK